MTSTNVVPFDSNVKLPAILTQPGLIDDDDLTSGVSGGFAVISFRGSKWRIKFQGEETPVVDGEGNPVSTLEVVLLKANSAISKNFYEAAFTDGAAEAPDCFSLDGIAPEPSSPKLQSTTCASCPKNVFGSRMTPAGKKAKACADNRRMAVVPLGDVENSTFGGPMLLRVPAASLADLKMFGETMKKRGYPYNAVAVRLGFDLDAAYPKLTFKAIRPLTDEEAQHVVNHLQGDVVGRILATAEEVVGAPVGDSVPAVDPDFEQPAPPPKAAAQTRAQAAPQPAPKPAPAAAAQPAPKAGGTFGAKNGAAPAPAKTGGTFGAKPAAAPAAPAAAAPKPAASVKPAAKPAPKPAPVEAEPVQGELLATDSTEGQDADPTANGLDLEIEGILEGLDSLG
jgi:hypothetical protein